MFFHQDLFYCHCEERSDEAISFNSYNSNGLHEFTQVFRYNY
jgi:hypothetical protein